MFVEILNADLRITVSIDIVASTKDSCIFDIQRKKVTQSIDFVHDSAFLTMIIELVNDYNAVIEVLVTCADIKECHLLNDRIYSFCKNTEFS